MCGTDRLFLIVLASLLLWPWDPGTLPDCAVLSRQHIGCLRMHLLHVQPDVEELVDCSRACRQQMHHCTIV